MNRTLERIIKESGEYKSLCLIMGRAEALKQLKLVVTGSCLKVFGYDPVEKEDWFSPHLIDFTISKYPVLICNLVRWSDTPQGEEYWEDLQNKLSDRNIA